MIKNNNISDYYLHGSLLPAIKAALTTLGKTADNVSIEDLAPVDEFHVGGRIASENLLAQLNFSNQGHILDVGCGLGGAARFVANKYARHVNGIDLSKEYIETGNKLSEWVNLDKRVTLQQGNATALPFDDETFVGGYMLHVGMNIEKKSLLFSEINRVLSHGAFFGIYDIMRDKSGGLMFPVPWASDSSMNCLETADQYKQALIEAGFEVINVCNRREFGLNFFKEMRVKNEANGGLPPLGLHTLMQATTPVKIKNLIDNIVAKYISPVEIVAKKKGRTRGGINH